MRNPGMVGARRRRRRQGYGTRSSSRTSSPYLRSFASPTPDTRRRSERFVGCATAIAARVESWNTTYAGTPAARAVSERHRRRRSMVSTGASAPFVVRFLRLSGSGGGGGGGVVPPRFRPPAGERRGRVGQSDAAAEPCDGGEARADRGGGNRFFRRSLGEAVVARGAPARHALLAEVVRDSRVPALAHLGVGHHLAEPCVG